MVHSCHIYLLLVHCVYICYAETIDSIEIENNAIPETRASIRLVCTASSAIAAGVFVYKTDTSTEPTIATKVTTSCYDDGFCTTSQSADGRITYTSDNLHIYIAITNLNRTVDGKWWWCQHASSGSIKSLHLVVYYGPESLAVSPSPTTYIRNEGTSLQNITCSDSCYPDCTYTWTKTGRTGSLTTTGVLSLGLLNRTEVGNYTCTASNHDRTNSPQTKKTVSLNVRYGPDIALINGESPYTVTEENTRITIGCTSDCYPCCSFSWTNITSSSPTGTDGVISLAKVTRYDAGRYRCVSSNTASQYNKVATSTVTVIVQYAPDVTVTTQNMTVNDSHVDILCSPSGVPASYTYQPWTQAWISDGRTVPLLTQLGHSPALRLTDLSYQHSGVYTCRASNGVTGSINDNAGQGDVHLKVESFPIITKPVISNGQYHTVLARLEGHSTTNISVQYYNNGDAANVKCYKLDNNSRRTTTKHSLSTEPSIVHLPVFTQMINTTGTMVTVTITIRQEFQLGDYVIVIKNTIGETILPVHILHEGPPYVPEELSVNNLHQTHVTISWIQGFYGGYDQTFVIQLSLDNSTWWNKTSIFGGKDISRDHINAIVDKLLPGTQYYVRMFAYNQVGKGPFTVTMNFTTNASVYTEQSESSYGAVIGGVGGGIITIVLVVVVVVILNRKYQVKTICKCNCKCDFKKKKDISKEIHTTPSSDPSYDDLTDRKTSSQPYDSLYGLEMQQTTNQYANLEI